MITHGGTDLFGEAFEVVEVVEHKLGPASTRDALIPEQESLRLQVAQVRATLALINAVARLTEEIEKFR